MAPKSPGSYRITRPTIREKIYRANVIISHGMNGLEIIKSRYHKPEKNPTLSEVIDVLVRSYYRADMTEELTPSAMMNVPIKKDLEKAISEVLIKHGITRRKI
jgi:hypothetical protein